MTQEVIVNIEDPTPPIVVVVEDSDPEISVTVSDVGLVGPPGASGDPTEVVDLLEAEIDAHVNSETPHPVYDDGPSLSLLYINAKV